MLDATAPQLALWSLTTRLRVRVSPPEPAHLSCDTGTGVDSPLRDGPSRQESFGLGDHGRSRALLSQHPQVANRRVVEGVVCLCATVPSQCRRP